MIKYLLGFILLSTQVFSQGFLLGVFKPTATTPPTVVQNYVDDAVVGSGNNQVFYSSPGVAWVQASKPGSYNGTHSYNNVNGAYLEIPFVGIKAEVVAELFPNKGITSVSIDGSPATGTGMLNGVMVGGAVSYDAYGPAESLNQTVWISGTLTNAAHTIRLTVTNTKNALATDYYTDFDALRVSSNGSTPAPGTPTGDWFVAQTGCTSGCSDANDGLTPQTAFLTIQKSSTVAQPGDLVTILPGDYRETIVPTNSGTSGNEIIYQASAANTVTVNGTNLVNTSWTVHSGNIYKTTISLPNATNYNTDLSGWTDADFGAGSSNTSLLTNQIFFNKVMMPQARFPNVTNFEDMRNRHGKFRNKGSTTQFTKTQITDTGLGSFGSLVGGTISVGGWFLMNTGTISAHSGNQITFGANPNANTWFDEYYYVTNKLTLLDAVNEWQYESGVLYFYAPGAVVPSTGTVEYKARNWGFDLRNKSYIKIQGINFYGCDAVNTTGSSASIVVDNIKQDFGNQGILSPNTNAEYLRGGKQVGIRLIGPNNVIKNSEITHSGVMGVWLGQNGVMTNNKFNYIENTGGWGAPFKPVNGTNGQQITYNTSTYTGRGFAELSSANATNMRIAYNDISHHNSISNDGGAIYSQANRNHSGTRIDHNWFHNPDCYRYTPSGDGTQITGVYLDQASGSQASSGGKVTIDHNVMYEGVGQMTGDTDAGADYYAELANGGGSTGGHILYNNTFASTSQYSSYTVYVTSVSDKQRNNIYRDNVNIANGGGAGDITNSLFQGTSAVFLGTGTGGLAYRPASGYSAAIDKGTDAIGAPYTDGKNGTIDIGAYEYLGTGGAADWVPGYTAVTYVPTTGSTGGGGITVENIATLGTVSDITTAYNTSFGTNGIGVGLPSTITATFTGGGTGTVGMTWAIGSYDAVSPFYSDATYAIVGTPVTTSGITNSGALTKTVNVTVKNAFFPLTSTILAIYDLKTGNLVTNTTNAYGVVDASNNITSIKSIAPGPTGRNLASFNTAPKLTSGRAVLIGTGSWRANISAFAPLSYNATPANLKSVWIFAGNFTDDNQSFNGILGNNGFFGANTGYSINWDNSSTNNNLGLFIGDGSGNAAIQASFSGVISAGSNNVYALRLDNSLAAGSGKVTAFNSTGSFNVTSTGNGVISATAQPANWDFADEGTNSVSGLNGNMDYAIQASGTETDVVLTKFLSDLRAYLQY